MPPSASGGCPKETAEHSRTNVICRILNCILSVSFPPIFPLSRVYHGDGRFSVLEVWCETPVLELAAMKTPTAAGRRLPHHVYQCRHPGSQRREFRRAGQLTLKKRCRR